MGFELSDSVVELGEDRVRDLISSRLEKDVSEILGYGDDAVAFEISDGQLLVMHTDALVASTDILPGMTAYDVGRKAVVMNVSDLLAKGVKPRSAIFSWGIPRNYTAPILTEIAEGMNRTAREYGIHVTGGDTGESDDFFLAGTVFGLVERQRLLRRSAVKPGHVIASTGPFGLSGVAYRILLHGATATPQIRDTALEVTYRPRLRFAEANAIAEAGVASAGIDSSDGLARSLHWLGRMSRVGFIVDNLPTTEEVKQFGLINKVDYVDLALYEGGEEYELIYAISQDKWTAALEAVERVGGKLYRIGVATSDPQIVLDLRNMPRRQIQDLGWRHFAGWDKPT
jgi:thiamine-monophosphate kinase